MARMRFGLASLAAMTMLAEPVAGRHVVTPATRAAAAADQAARIERPRRRGVSALPRARAPVRNAVAASRPQRGGGWRIQLGAYNNIAAARAQWGLLYRRVGALAGFRPSYEPAGRYMRLRTGPYPSRAEADRACAAARSAGQACFSIRG